MGNQITFSGSGELDNGMNVALSFTIDQADDTLPFDGHSVTVSSDAMGSLKFSGEGGSSATSSMDATAAGDIWDGFDGAVATGVTGVTIGASGGVDNSMLYTLPSLMDGLSVFASYNPQHATASSETGIGATYTGIDGLTVSYAQADEETGTAATSGDQTAWKIAYAYGPVTATMTNNDYDMGTSTNDKETSSVNLSYTVSDELSISYGAETIDVGSSTTDAEYSAVVVAYTSGGMTITGKMEDADNVDNSTNSNADIEYWFLGAAFAF
jgi:outer membrane protein OmpU